MTPWEECSPEPPTEEERRENARMWDEHPYAMAFGCLAYIADALLLIVFGAWLVSLMR